MDKFIEYDLKLLDKQKELVLNYMKRVKEYVETYSLDIELYNDIEEMFFEKLSSLKQINELNIRKIIKEIWEPEVIFADYITTSKPNFKNTKKIINDLFFTKLQEKSFERDNENAIFLWISKPLADKSWISIFWMRVILLILLFPMWVSMWFYVIAWLILPVKWVDYSSIKTNFAYLRIQLLLLIKNWIYNLSKSFVKLLAWLPKEILKICKITIDFISRNFWPIIRFFFFGFIWFMSFCLLIWYIFALWIILSKFSFQNIDFISVLPDVLKYWLIFWVIGFSIITFISFAYWFFKKKYNSWVFVSWFLCLIISTILLISSGFSIFSNYSQENKITKNYETKVLSWNTYNLELNDKSILDNRGTNSINLIKTDNDILKIEIKNTFFWNNLVYEKINELLDNTKIINENNNILLNNDKKIVKNIIPTLISKDYNIYLPAGINLNLSWNNWNHYYENAQVKKYNFLYNTEYNDNCYLYKDVYFSFDENKFVCDLSDDEISQLKQEYIKEVFVRDFDKISPLKHHPKFKRDYY